MVAVPLSKRLGLGSVLGYLLAGIIIGPALGLVGRETQEIQHVAEFGVVMMLFLVGLELVPGMLWRLRNKLLGLGGLQVGATVAVIALAAMALGQPWQVAVAAGCILALSSTAIVLQTLGEKTCSAAPAGRQAFRCCCFKILPPFRCWRFCRSWPCRNCSDRRMAQAGMTKRICSPA